MKNSLRIYIDLGNINCYLGMKPTLALISDFGLDVAWLPISGIVKTVANRKPVISSTDELSTVKLKRLEARSRYEARELERNAARLGITVDGARHCFDQKFLHIALLYLNQCAVSPEAFINEVFEKAFRHKMDFDDVESVSLLIEKMGLNQKGYLDFLEDGALQLKELQTATLEKGIFDAPAYQFNGENYQGRAHLPLIRWYLNGASGTAPT